MRIPVLASVLVVGAAMLLAAPTTSEAGRWVSYRGPHHVRSHGSYGYRSYAYRPYVSFGFRPYYSYGYGSYYSYGYDPYCSYGYDPYYYGQRPVYVPRVYYAPRPLLGYYRVRPRVNIRIGF